MAKIIKWEEPLVVDCHLKVKDDAVDVAMAMAELLGNIHSKPQNRRWSQRKLLPFQVSTETQNNTTLIK
jgi:hypothetical protein